MPTQSPPPIPLTGHSILWERRMDQAWTYGFYHQRACYRPRSAHLDPGLHGDVSPRAAPLPMTPGLPQIHHRPKGPTLPTLLFLRHYLHVRRGMTANQHFQQQLDSHLKGRVDHLPSSLALYKNSILLLDKISKTSRCFHLLVWLGYLDVSPKVIDIHRQLQHWTQKLQLGLHLSRQHLLIHFERDARTRGQAQRSIEPTPHGLWLYIQPDRGGTHIDSSRIHGWMTMVQWKLWFSRLG